jgi:hypothetical protein
MNRNGIVKLHQITIIGSVKLKGSQTGFIGNQSVQAKLNPPNIINTFAFVSQLLRSNWLLVRWNFSPEVRQEPPKYDWHCKFYNCSIPG